MSRCAGACVAWWALTAVTVPSLTEALQAVSPQTEPRAFVRVDRRSFVGASTGAALATALTFKTSPASAASQSKTTTTTKQRPLVLRQPTPMPSDMVAACSVLPRAVTLAVPDVARTAAFLVNAVGMVEIDGRGLPETGTYAFGPTSLRRPADYRPGVDTFDGDGGHCAIVLREDETAVAGDEVAFLQFACASIRASKILRNGGELLDAYGVVDVLPPGGVPVRLLLGDETRDRFMYVALRCADVAKSAAFYRNELGFSDRPYPRARPPVKGETAFDPDPPKGSVYLSPCDDALGVLLLPSRASTNTLDTLKRSPKIVRGSVYQGIDVWVNNPFPTMTGDSSSDPGKKNTLRDLLSSEETTPHRVLRTLTDPDGYPARLLDLPSVSAALAAA